YAQIRIRGYLDFSKIFLGPEGVHPSPATWISLTDEYVGEPPWDPGVDQGTFVWRQSPGGPWELRCSTPFVNYDSFDGRLRDGTAITGVVEHAFEDPHFVSGGPKLWRNDGGSFSEITGALGLPAAMVNPRDVSWVDYDNDGDYDLHVVDMGTSATLNAPDALFRNDGALFTDVTIVENVMGGSQGLGDGATWGDADRDGDLDVYVAQGAGPLGLGGAGPALLYRNEGDWPPSLQLSLIGRRSGPAALGAKVTASVGGRMIVRQPTANSWRGFGDPREIHIGLGDAELADWMLIQWPSGTTHFYTDVQPGFYHVDEAEEALDAPAVPVAIGRGWRIVSVRPQPARGSQSVLLSADRTVSLEIGVYDLGGRLVRTLHQGLVGAGTTVLGWNGRDSRDRRVSSGVYFVRVSDGRSIASTKSVRVR
ncbi:MAG: FlgD immunoglobulin-like domain containing protein, partial [bacterium]